MSGGSSGSTATSTSSNSTTVNVSTSTPVTVDTSDLSDAIQALAGADLVGKIYTAQTSALAQVASAQIAASTPNYTNLILIGLAVIGFLITARIIKVKV